MKKHLVILSLIVWAHLGLTPSSEATIKRPRPKALRSHRAPTQVAALPSVSLDEISRDLIRNTKELNPRVVKLGLQAYFKARALGLTHKSLLTIVDYSKPSSQDRMWVLDLKKRSVVFKELVAHGKNSGDQVATRFSDLPRSQASSLGVYVTGSTFFGKNGFSLKLDGLEKGFNANAATRGIVVHAASYVTPDFAKTSGRIGRSQGCFAIDPRVASSVINAIKDGSLIFAYYPDQNWLRHSFFLRS